MTSLRRLRRLAVLSFQGTCAPPVRTRRQDIRLIRPLLAPSLLEYLPGPVALSGTRSEAAIAGAGVGLSTPLQGSSSLRSGRRRCVIRPGSTIHHPPPIRPTWVARSSEPPSETATHAHTRKTAFPGQTAGTRSVDSNHLRALDARSKQASVGLRGHCLLILGLDQGSPQLNALS